MTGLGYRLSMETNPDHDTQEATPNHRAFGAEGGDESPAADVHPSRPSDDDSELGDTDQHSDA